jgi:hypothetical protein
VVSDPEVQENAGRVPNTPSNAIHTVFAVVLDKNIARTIGRVHAGDELCFASSSAWNRFLLMQARMPWLQEKMQLVSCIMLFCETRQKWVTIFGADGPTVA